MPRLESLRDRLWAIVLAAVCVMPSVAPGAGEAAGQAATPRDIAALETAAQQAEMQGRYQAVIDAHTQAIELAQAAGRPRLAGVLLHRLGTALLRNNQTQDAVFAFESGLRALSGDPTLNLGALFSQLSRVGKGIPEPDRPVPADLYSEAVDRELGVEEADPALTVKLLIGVGNAYLLQPQDGPALNAYRQALQRPEIEREPRLKAHALANSGEILRRQGQAASAREALTEAIRILDAEGQPLDKRRALTLLAGIYRDQGEHGKSLAQYRQALVLYERAADTRGEAAARAGLGYLLLLQGRCADAIPAYRRAVTLASATSNQNVLWPSYLGLGKCQRALGRLDEAADALSRSLEIVRDRQGDLRTDEGKVGLLESAQDVFDELLDVQLARARRNPAAFVDLLSMAEQARGSALRELMRGWGPSRRPDAASFGLPDCLGDGSKTEGAESVAGGRRGGESPQAQMAIGVWTRAEGPLAAPNAAAVPAPLPNAPAMHGARAPAEGREPVSARPPLPRLVYYVLEDKTLIFAVAADGKIRGHVAAIGREGIAARVEQLRRALNVQAAARGVRGAALAEPSGTEARPDFDARSRELFDLLVAPLAAGLPPRGETLALEPHGALWLLPFAALRAADGEWLAERWPLVYSPSADLLEEARARPLAKKRQELKGLIIGNPIVAQIEPGQEKLFRMGFAPLPGAEEEATLIVENFPGERAKLLRGSEGDLATFVREASGYDVLHLATHGIARPDNPLSSFILLAPSVCGELLTARRVMTLVLDADLVALSACQTGLGRVTGEGVIGLSRAFLFAGARSVLVSHWSISDHATTSLMTGFYQHYLGGGATKAQALRDSMTDLRQQPGYEHPRYWAPFFLVGAES